MGVGLVFGLQCGMIDGHGPWDWDVVFDALIRRWMQGLLWGRVFKLLTMAISTQETIAQVVDLSVGDTWRWGPGVGTC